MRTKRFSQQHTAFCMILRRAREDQKLTQEALARRLGAPQSFVSKYETGERRLDFLETLDVCVALGISVQRIVKALGRETRPEPSANNPVAKNGR